ncbi:MAG: RNA polymerase sigma factor [Planctomycetes bacterium]|nr:RNA polymerase sigma factor [Planctomycetota bacterium]
MTRKTISESGVLRAQAGDADSLEDLALAFLPRVYGLALRLTRDAQTAEEATQETFLRVLRNLGALKNRARLDGWILRIATNVVRDMARRRGREQPLTYEPPAIDAARDDFEAARQKAIDLALGELSFEERELFLLHTVEGMRLKTLAKTHKLTLPAITSKVHRTRAKVRAKAMKHMRAAGAIS